MLGVSPVKGRGNEENGVRVKEEEKEAEQEEWGKKGGEKEDTDPAMVIKGGGDAMLGDQGMPTVKSNPNKGFKSTKRKGLLSLTSGSGTAGGGITKNRDNGRENNKENRPPLDKGLNQGLNQGLSQGGRTVEPKKTARIGERAMLKGKPVLRDILNDLMDGGY